ncbi:uncharacterized protein LOC125493443 [Beta vulgaris subsp. vulgaris]|uniref:uncharacterized protein LOC125493443 n=1 Tax=Beta vulgaris subsp. vulgaris TaxID=3555 RepID=UPI0020372FFB|nr:uncharacterized protein LOC125493443 [Beta vulgaris subsp. vulgaris]
MSHMSAYAKFLKQVLSNKRKLEDELITLPYQASALVQCAMPKKQRDPGSFTLLVKIGDLEPKGVLADLGAYVSLMPLSIAKHLNLPLPPTRNTIQLAGQTVRVPHSELEDVLIPVGRDFVVMDMVRSGDSSHSWEGIS